MKYPEELLKAWLYGEGPFRLLVDKLKSLRAAEGKSAV